MKSKKFPKKPAKFRGGQGGEAGRAQTSRERENQIIIIMELLN